ncbi:MAG: gluconate 2-dehydrogenase subunit 3 family protein [Gemmobacter sp.]
MTGRQAAGGGPSRRAALSAMLSVGLAPLLPPSAAWADAPHAALGAVLDTLLPDDGLTPAATALGLDAELRDLLAGNDLLSRLFATALDWMDSQGPRPFRDLSPADRTAMLAAMAASDPNLIPGRFYHVVRALAVELYYARPEALAGLPLRPAPQPFGYPPQGDPPRWG